MRHNDLVATVIVLVGLLVGTPDTLRAPRAGRSIGRSPREDRRDVRDRIR